MFFGWSADSAPRQLAFWYGTASVTLPSNCSRTVLKRPGPIITPSSKPTKSHRFIEFYVQQKCHCSPRGLERIVLTVTRYDRCTRNAVPAGHLRREYPMRGEDSNHRAA